MSATYGMPMIVEFGVALDVLVAVLVLGIFFFQIREQFDSLDLHHLEAAQGEPPARRESVLEPTPYSGGGSLGGVRAAARHAPRTARCFSACFGARRWAPELNVAVSLVTFLAACALTARVVREGPLVVAHEQFFIDPFNVFLVTLTALVGLTTALFSRPYMRVELDHGRVSAPRLRLYHSMYQLFMTTMLIALTTNNMGLVWVAMEAATLSTVLLVTLYRTPASLEAGWKYFILCGVGIAQALFGTILLYFAAEKVLGAEGVTALLWTHLNAVKGQLEPTVLGLAFVFLLVGYGTKVGLAPLHNWLPDAHAEGPTPISAVLSGLLLNVAIYAVVRCKSARRRLAALRNSPRACSWASGCSRSYWQRSFCGASATSSASLPTPRSSTWGSSPLPLEWAARWRPSRRSCI